MSDIPDLSAEDSAPDDASGVSDAELRGLLADARASDNEPMRRLLASYITLRRLSAEMITLIAAREARRPSSGPAIQPPQAPDSAHACVAFPPAPSRRRRPASGSRGRKAGQRIRHPTALGSLRSVLLSPAARAHGHAVHHVLVVPSRTERGVRLHVSESAHHLFRRVGEGESTAHRYPEDPCGAAADRGS